MANYSQPNQTALDFFTEGLKDKLYNRICSRWQVDDSNFNCFGRTTRDNVSDGYIPQYYDADKRAYVTGLGKNNAGGLFFEDSVAGLFYFGLADIKEDKGVATAKVPLYFFVRLDKIKPGGLSAEQQAGQRLDEVAINDVRNYIQANGFNFTLHGVVRDIDKILDKYSGAAKRDSLKNNMNEKLCFRLDLEIRYNPLLNRVKNPIPAIMPQLVPQTLRLFIKTVPDTSLLIRVGYNRYIQQEYAPGHTLTPKKTGDSNSFLAGKKVVYPFSLNDQEITIPDYNETTGVWTRTSPDAFRDGDYVAITVMNSQFN